MLPSLTSIERYIRETLAVESLDAKAWERVNELPYFLRDTFDFTRIVLLGKPVVLAISREQGIEPLSDIRIKLDKIRSLTGLRAVYVTNALASYQRRRLIEQKVPFIVPGNQLYLPDLGLDLREYFRQRAPSAEAALSPSAQAILINALLSQPWQSDWQPSTIAVALGYTPMTLSRAVKELTAAGLATAYTVGRSRWLRMEIPPNQVWEHARPMLRTPVKRTVFVANHSRFANNPHRLAGLSALAHYSMLSEPKCPVYALTAADWKAATDAGVSELPGPEPGAQEWQLWNYNPALVPDVNTVDPLSLILSLQNSTDERIQLGLDELKGRLPW